MLGLRILTCCILLASVGSVRVAHAQQNITVQLPTFEVVGVSTTVVVPDQGRLSLGSVNRSALGRSQFGPGLPGLGNRGIGRATSSGAFSISATVIDNHEIDRALLAEAARRRGATVDIYGRPVANAPRVSPIVYGQRPAPQTDQRRVAQALWRASQQSRTESQSKAVAQTKVDRIRSRWQAK